MAFIVTNERTAIHAGHPGVGVMPLLLQAGPRGDSGYEVQHCAAYFNDPP